MYLVTFVYSVANNYKLKQHFLRYFLDYLYLNGERERYGISEDVTRRIIVFHN